MSKEDPDAKYYNKHKHLYRQKRRMKLLDEDRLDLLQRLDEIEYYADLDLLALEGLEVSSDLDVPIGVNFIMTRGSGRFYLDISKIDNDLTGDETIVDSRSHGWIKVEVRDS